ncbi:MAG: phosphoribulokinase [Gaiellaceae bacterium]|nr:MAG: phosphoribulokinase [Gaiellaceae bacterium]
MLGDEYVSRLSTDDYHRFDRRQRLERGLTPLHPDCNYLDILTQHLRHIRANEPVLKPVYRHSDGTFGPPEYFVPGPFVVAEGLLGHHTPELRQMFDVRVFLDPPEELRRMWKLKRDVHHRGYTTDEVLQELDRREHDAEAYIRPQRRHADIVVSFQPGDSEDQAHLDAHLLLRDSLVHPDLSGVALEDDEEFRLVEHNGAQELFVSGGISAARAAEIEEAIWERMHFARHLRHQRLGEFTRGTDLARSHSLAVVQLLILYHLATARAVVALGGKTVRSPETAVLG